MDRLRSAKVVRIVYAVAFGVGVALTRIHSVGDVHPVLSSSTIAAAVMAIAVLFAEESVIAPRELPFGAKVEHVALNGLVAGAIISVAACLIWMLLG